MCGFEITHSKLNVRSWFYNSMDDAEIVLYWNSASMKHFNQAFVYFNPCGNDKNQVYNFVFSVPAVLLPADIFPLSDVFAHHGSPSSILPFHPLAAIWQFKNLFQIILASKSTFKKNLE